MPITYGSVCSGIEAATMAWHPLGMRATWFAEIEAFPSAVLAHHYPNTPNLGDMTKLGALVLAGKIETPDVLVGGTPCRAFSVAGMRQGLLDPRGALTIKYVELADATDYVRASNRTPPCVIVWENVPGVLSDKGNAFGCFLGALAGEDCELQPSGKRWPDAGCVYGPKRTIVWRVVDAQYSGLAQRRRRVFVVASARGGFDPTEVLFEREGVRRDTAPRRGEGQDVTGTAPFGHALQCGCGHVFGEELGPYGCVSFEGDEGPAVSMFGGIPAFGGHSLDGSVERSATLTAKDSRLDIESETFFFQSVPDVVGTLRSTDGGADVDHGMAGHLVAGTLNANGKAAGSATQQDAESGLLVVQEARAFTADDYKEGTFTESDTARPLTTSADRSRAAPIVVTAFNYKDHGADVGAISPTLRTMNHSGSHANAGGQVAVCITDDITHTLKADGFDGSEDGTGRGQPIVATVSGTLGANHGNVKAEHAWTGQLIPRECERLQGMRDDYTQIPWRGKPAEDCPDGPRYKAIGNSKAVTVVRRIGQRILKQITPSPCC